MKKDIDDYLQEGIYGPKEINPSERKMYLGTLRERVVIALSKAQVMKNKGLKELDELMRENQGLKLLFNGNVSYRFFKKYKALASKHNIPYTTVNNREAKSDYGAVLTYDHAVDQEDIFLEEIKDVPKQEKKRSLFDFLFNRQ